MDLIIFVGLQASGKSTFYRTHFANTHDYVSKDLLRNNKRPARRQLQLVEAALQTGRSVVVDNTNPTPEDRAPLIALGQHYHATIIAYFFAIDVPKSLERNEQRTGKAHVPPVGIFSTVKKLTKPTLAEGFNELFFVQAHENFIFHIAKIKERTSTYEHG